MDERAWAFMAGAGIFWVVGWSVGRSRAGLEETPVSSRDSLYLALCALLAFIGLAGAVA